MSAALFTSGRLPASSCQVYGGRLLATGLSDHYHEILALTRLEEAIVIYPTEQEAIAALN